MFLLPSGQRQALRLTGWVNELHFVPSRFHLPLLHGERNGAKGKVRGHHPPFLSRSAGEEGGWGEGEGHQACAAALAL